MPKNISYREPAGSAIFGHTDVVSETTRIHIRGYANTSGNMIYAEDSLGVERFKVLENGEVYSNGNLLGAGGAGAILTVERNVSSAEILNLFSSPITLIPAPGVGKVIIVFRAVVRYTFVSVAYTTNTTYTLSIGSLNSNFFSSRLGFTANSWDISGAQDVNLSTAVIDNTALRIQGSVGNPLAGNGTMKITVYYAIANV